MLQISFITGARKIIKFTIKGKVITYFDDIWKDGIQIMPKDQNLIEKLRRSGKLNLKLMAALIIDSNSGDNLKEYEKCQTEEDFAKMIRKDASGKGLMEVR